MPTHLVTGAGSGIGSAIARALLKRGEDLVLLARTPERADDLALDFPDAQVLVADLAKPAALAEVILGHDFLTVLVSIIHAAGLIELGPVAALGAAVWQATMNVNLLAPAELTRLCLPALRANRGHVVFLNSTAGLVANPERAAYAASKFGLRALADSLRLEEHGSGVRVTSLYPGRVATPMQERVLQHEGTAYDPASWISPEAVAAGVLMALDMPADSVLTDLTMRIGPP